MSCKTICRAFSIGRRSAEQRITTARYRRCSAFVMRRSGVRLFSPAPASVSGWRFVTADPFVGAGLRRIRRRRCRPGKGKRLAARLARAKASRWLHGGYTPSLNESQLRDLGSRLPPSPAETAQVAAPQIEREHERKYSGGAAASSERGLNLD